MSTDNVASLFDVRSHNPSFFAVKESAAFEGELLDFCIPVNHHGLMVRECSNKVGSSEQYVRLAVQGRAAVDVLVPALRAELARMLARPAELAA